MNGERVESSGHCCACARAEDAINVLGIAAQVAVEGSCPRVLQEHAGELLTAAFKRALSAIELASMPKLGP